MSNNAMKNFFIIFAVVIIGGLVIFAISKSTGVPDNKLPKESEIKDIGVDANGNEIIEVDGEESIFLE